MVTYHQRYIDALDASIQARLARLENREADMLAKDIREHVRETLEETTNLPDDVMYRAVEQIVAFIVRRIQAERSK